MQTNPLHIAMFCIHSCPMGELGAKDTGGMNVYVYELAFELGRRGHHVDIFTRWHDPDDSELMHLSPNVRLIHLKAGDDERMPKLALFHYLDDFIRELEAFQKQHDMRYDLVHSHYWLSGYVGAWAQKEWRAPHVIMFHTLGAIKNRIGASPLEPQLRIRTETKLAQTCDRIIAATPLEKTELSAYYGASSKNIAVIPCGVNPDRFQPIDQKVARRKIGFDNHCKLVLFVGRSDPLKGLDRLLHAIRRLASQRRVELVIVGGDQDQTAENRKIKALSKRLAIDPLVRFAGNIDQKELPFYYSAADVLAIPSLYESFGLVALEALACGTPVAATRVGGMDAIIRDDQCGCIVPDASPLRIADGIQTCLERPRLNGQAANAIRAVSLKYTWSCVADMIIQQYGDMLGSR